MGTCVIEIYSLCPESAYQNAFKFIKELAVDLREAILLKDKNAWKKVKRLPESSENFPGVLLEICSVFGALGASHWIFVRQRRFAAIALSRRSAFNGNGALSGSDEISSPTFEIDFSSESIVPIDRSFYSYLFFADWNPRLVFAAQKTRLIEE